MSDQEEFDGEDELPADKIDDEELQAELERYRENRRWGVYYAQLKKSGQKFGAAGPEGDALLRAYGIEPRVDDDPEPDEDDKPEESDES